jgi:Lrp/AsnC family transcriptional regulator, leucine-responsive regulatory protein
MVDDINRKILELLQADARLSNAELAREVGLTVSSVHERVKKMEKAGIIRGYVALVDAEMLGKPLLAFLRLTVSSHSEAQSSMRALCASEPDILECHNVAGEDCFIIKVRAESPKKLEQVLGRIRNASDTSRSVTSIVLSTYKESSRVDPAGVEGGVMG